MISEWLVITEEVCSMPRQDPLTLYHNPFYITPAYRGSLGLCWKTRKATYPGTMAEEIAAKIEAQGELVRKLKGEKAAPEAIQAEVKNLLALKEQYKSAAGHDYKPPGQTSSKTEKKAPTPPPAKDGPSKKELKKLEKKEKKAQAKSGDAAAGGALAAATEGAGKKADEGVKEPTLYPGDDVEGTHAILAIAQMGGVKLKRGYGSKIGFFGKGPFLEVPPGGQVVSGVEAIVRAVSLLYAPALQASRPLVDNWLEWCFRKLIAAVAQASEDVSKLIHEMTVLEGALTTSPLLVDSKTLTLADVVLAPLTKKALTFFGEHEYIHSRKWVAHVLASEPFKATEALVAKGGAFQGSDVEINFDPRLGLYAIVEAIFTAAIHKAFPEMAGEEGFQVADVAKCGNPAHGDYQCNNAMGIYKALKAKGTGPAKPQEVAQKLITNISSSAMKDIFSSVSVAGAGFINISIQDSYLKQRVKDILDHGPQATAAQKRKVLVDFSSPNIAKEMHVGHLRSTIIGDSVCRMLEFLGHDVMRINHVGDWGTQFGMLINYLKDEYPDFMTNPPNITDLTSFYKNAKVRFDEDADFKERSRLGVVELQSGNPESRAIWKLLCDISRLEFQKVYDRLEVRLEEYGESYYNAMIPGAIEELSAKGLLEADNGATIMWCGGKHTYPLMVRKSDGGFGYDSTDLAAIRYRLKDLDRDWVIYITDAGQAGHFYMIFDAARLVGWVDPQKHRLDHVGFGVVQGEDGKRLKTRSGETVRLVDLLDEAVQRMETSLAERIKDGKSSLTPEEAKKTATILGYGAVKYADLKQNPTTDYQFSYDRMLDTKGDTAIYLLFTCARLHSILRKAEEEKGINVKELVATSDVVLEHPAERALALELAQFAEAINIAVSELMPNRICTYVFTLSAKGTDFLETCHVLTAPHRLLLVQATVAAISRCLVLLGITPVTKI